MKKLSRFATAAALFMCLPASALLAQSTPNTGTDAAPSAPATTTPAPAAAPAAAPATATPTTTAAPPTTTTDKDMGTKKKKSGKKMTRQQEIDKSVESGTVPSRYRSSVPKQYQKYIPFEK